MKKYRTKPATVIAFQISGDPIQIVKLRDEYPEIKAILICGIMAQHPTMDNKHFGKFITIRYSGENLRVFAGDWLVKQIDGQFHPYKNETFKNTYEEVI